ncbi:MAG: peptidylprolyl isomerase [Proteobacteria bacterium]|nr:peptidylprolyl isomerase [Pseudomonadota bacterium]
MKTKIILLAFLFIGFFEASATTVVRFKTVLGDFDVQLYDEVAPETVANFLNYVRRGDYDGTIIHRSVRNLNTNTNFVVQGGGFVVGGSVPVAIQADPAVINEFSISNTRGTLAMAKIGGNPDSATNQWFFNMSDNSGSPAFLDTANGGFTVFGKVMGNGMQVVDAITALQRLNFSELAGFGAFTETPTIYWTGANAGVDILFLIDEIVELDSEFVINAGLSGAWYNAATGGQGEMIEVYPELGKVFFAMFTYDTEQPDGAITSVIGDPGHKWFSAFGDYSGDTVVLDVRVTSGGLFNDSESTVSTTLSGSYGTMTIVFHDCSNATMTFEFFGSLITGEVELIRLASDNVPLCEKLALEAAMEL